MSELNLPESIEINREAIPEYQEFSGLKNLSCRAVIVGGKSTKEYHLKPLRSINLGMFASIIQGMVEESTVNLTDPDGLLRLEWPVMLKIESMLGNEIIEDTLKEIDQYLERNVQ